MGTFLYFVACPGRAGFLPGEGRLLPLGERSCVRSSKGADEGFLVFDEKSMPLDRRCIKEYSQRWEPWGTVEVNGEEAAVQVGVWEDCLPGPEDVKKDDPLLERIEGVPVRLADGNVWEAPKIVEVDGSSCLPGVLKITEEGLRPELPSSWKRLSELARRMLGMLLVQGEIVRAGDLKVLSDRELSELILLSMGMLYRVGAPEINVLELFEEPGDDKQGSAGRWLAALCGIDLESPPTDDMVDLAHELRSGGHD